MDWKTWALTIVVPALVYWVAVGALEFLAARAEADGVEDWQDLLWPRLLARVNRTRYEDVRRRVADRLTKDDDQ